MTVPRQRLLGDRYALAETIGVGGMAEVYRGTDTRLGRDVAVKVLRADLARDPVFQQRFRREAQSAASLNAPCIVSVYDTGEDALDDRGGVPWIVMEHVRGRTLREVVEQEGRVLPQRALEIVADVCAALQVAHDAGIVHRDIKPANVMLTPTGEVKVMDFGIARAAASSSSTVTQTSAIIGTAAYLSPEQARGEHVDARSDLYSTGCLLYELLTGFPPFAGDSPVAVAYQHVREDPVPPSTHDPALAPEVDAVVLKAMAKNPQNRYATADAMREDLLRAAVGDPVEATPLLPPDALPAVRPVGSTRVDGPGAYGSRTRALVYGAFGLLLLAIVLALALLVRGLLTDPQLFVETPDVVGLSQQDAQLRLAESGLAVGRLDQRFDDEPVGTVVEQSPAPLINLEEGGVVDLVVSLGVEMTLVPDVVGISRREAQAQLEQAQLEVERVVERGGNVAPGQVLEVLPEPGTQVPADGEVVLVVASGQVEVPLVVGQSQADAVQELQRAGFDVGIRLQADPGRPGRVLSQSPSNSTAQRGSTVVVTVSAVAPEPTPPPSPTPSPSASAGPSPTPSASAAPTPTGTPGG